MNILLSKEDYTYFKEQIIKKETEILELKETLITKQIFKLNEIENLLNDTQTQIESIKEIIAINPKEVDELKKELNLITEKAKKLELENKKINIARGIVKDASLSDVKEIINSIPTFKILSDYEKDIISIFYKSKGSATNIFIASQLNHSESSIKNTLRSIYKKLNIPSRSALINLINTLINNQVHENV